MRTKVRHCELVPVLIAHVLPFGGVGGTEIATLRLAQAARRQGFSNLIFYLEGAQQVQALFAADGFPTVSYVDEKVYLSVRNAFRWTWKMREFAAVLRRHKVQILHAADVRAGTLVAPAARLAGIPVLCHVRNRFDSLPVAERLALHAVQRFVFVSAATWKQFCVRVSPGRGEVLYDGLEIRAVGAAETAATRESLLGAFGLPRDAVLISMVARIAPQKDYRTLAQAAASVVAHCRNVHFLLIGGVSEPAFGGQVKQWMEQAGVARHVHFTGFRSDIPALLAASDVFLLCTHFEGFPLVILEAMAQGRAVVATAVDGIPEIVQEGATGLLHEHEDAAGLAAQLVRLVENPALRNRLGAAGRELVQTRFSRGVYESAVGALYRRCLSMSGGSG